MLKVSKKWIADRELAHADILDLLVPGVGKLLFHAQGLIGTFPESGLTPAELLPATRPPNLKQDYKPGEMPEKLAACTDWFARWMACCAPRDEELRDEFLQQVTRRAELSR